jgi:hypothetical protein
MQPQAQLNLFDEDIIPQAANDNAPQTKWEAKFQQFHADNPHIYELVKKYTFEVIATGRQRFSMLSIFERIRWHTNVETTGFSVKLPQNTLPYYSRMFMRDFPEHDGFFRTNALGKKGPRQ